MNWLAVWCFKNLKTSSSTNLLKPAVLQKESASYTIDTKAWVGISLSLRVSLHWEDSITKLKTKIWCSRKTWSMKYMTESRHFHWLRRRTQICWKMDSKWLWSQNKKKSLFWNKKESRMLDSATSFQPEQSWEMMSWNPESWTEKEELPTSLMITWLNSHSKSTSGATSQLKKEWCSLTTRSQIWRSSSHLISKEVKIWRSEESKKKTGSRPI